MTKQELRRLGMLPYEDIPNSRSGWNTGIIVQRIDVAPRPRRLREYWTSIGGHPVFIGVDVSELGEYTDQQIIEIDNMVIDINN